MELRPPPREGKEHTGGGGELQEFPSERRPATALAAPPPTLLQKNLSQGLLGVPSPLRSLPPRLSISLQPRLLFPPPGHLGPQTLPEQSSCLQAPTVSRLKSSHVAEKARRGSGPSLLERVNCRLGRPAGRSSFHLLTRLTLVSNSGREAWQRDETTGPCNPSSCSHGS